MTDLHICNIHAHLQLIYSLYPPWEQDSPDSLFSFAIKISDDEGEEASSSLVHGIVLAEVKSKFEDLLGLLQQDTAQLEDDFDPAKAIFKTMCGQVPADVEEALF